MSASALKIAVIGGGITGLAAALHLKREALRRDTRLELALLESEARLGGNIRTINHGGFLIEAGPDSFALRAGPLAKLMEILNLRSELVRSVAGPVYVYTGDGLHPIPDGMFMGIPTRVLPLLATPLLSIRGKARALMDLMPRYSPVVPEDESVGSLLQRHFGAELVARVAAPLHEAIHADSVDQLSAAATLPGFAHFAGHRVSLISELHKAHAKVGRNLREARVGPLASIRGGLESLVAALQRELPTAALHLGATVEGIERASRGYSIRLRERAPIKADAVVLAVPGSAAGRVLAMPFEFKALGTREPASTASAAIAYRRDALPDNLKGTGLVVAAGAAHAISACTWVHAKWPHAVPQGSALLRCHVGYPADEALAVADDAVVLDAVRADLKRILGIDARPEFGIVTHWPEAMPRYTVGHNGRVAALTRRVAERFPGVFLAGASYGGAGLASCVAQGEAAAAAAFRSARAAVGEPVSEESVSSPDLLPIGITSQPASEVGAC